MSLLLLGKLKDVAKIRCRELRKRQTPAERAVWHMLRNRRHHGLKFNRQHPLFHDLEGRETFYIADFYCHELHLVIELDGAAHADRTEEDRNRDRILYHLGMKVLRYPNDIAIFSPHRILADIDERKHQLFDNNTEK
ncbi:MAG: endonuclease domain-containing protein [Bacteroidetes bacterium]|nr:endonuclease domain-containing protein [Bacteroidota bacterium]